MNDPFAYVPDPEGEKKPPAWRPHQLLWDPFYRWAKMMMGGKLKEFSPDQQWPHNFLLNGEPAQPGTGFGAPALSNLHRSWGTQ